LAALAFFVSSGSGLGLAALALLVLGFWAASVASVFAAGFAVAFAGFAVAFAGFAVAFAGFAVAFAGFAVAFAAFAPFAAAGFAVAFAAFLAAGLASDFAGSLFAASVFAGSVCSSADCVPTALADVAARVAEVFDAAVVFAVTGLTGANALGIAADIAVAASVSELTAVPIALVAALMACNVVVIVFAEEVTIVRRTVAAAGDGITRSVAWVAAVFSFAAAAVTSVAAETAPGVTAVPFADDSAEPVRLAPAVAWRVGFAAALCAGIDLPPIWTQLRGVLFHEVQNFTHRYRPHYKK
jgi:hypothetical protein